MHGNISACLPSELTPVHIAAAHHAISAQSAPPNSLDSAFRRPGGALWAAAYDSDLDYNDKLGLWRYEFPRPGDTPRPAIIKFKTKLDANDRELKKKVRIARGDLMKPGAEYNPDKTSSQTPSRTALRIFLAAGAAGSLPIEFLDVQEPTHEQMQTHHADKPCDSSRALTVVSNTRYASLSGRKR
jgi:hypothetical protein